MDDLDISFNSNVMSWVSEFGKPPEDRCAQEVVDVMLATMMLITIALDFEEAGQLIGKVMVETVKQAEIAKGFMV